MFVRSALISLTFLSILFPASAAAPQAPEGSDAAAMHHGSPVIRSTTRLVQVSVVVQDKRGNPVTGLKKEDFTVLDEGNRQEIAFFASSVPTPSVPSQLLPPNAFTNRYDLKGEGPGAVTVILFDLLNTFVADQAYVRKQILRFLQTVKPQDDVAVYALTTQLLVLHEFTQDASALVDAVNHFTPEEKAAFDASHPVKYHVAALANDRMWARFEDALNNINGKISDANRINRVNATVGAIKAIANHVSGIPGRKSLVWVSGGFPIQIGIPTIGKTEDQFQTDTTNQLPRTDRYAGSFAEDVSAAADALNRVNISMYTVDAHGVAPITGSDPALINGGFAQNSYALNAEEDTRAGPGFLPTEPVAWHFSEPTTSAMRCAMLLTTDASPIRSVFTPITPSGTASSGKSKSRLREQTGNFVTGRGITPPRIDSPPQELVSTELQETANSPLDATSLGMIVSCKVVNVLSARNLELHVGIDPKQLLLQNSEDHRKGAVDLFFLQQDGSAKIVAAEKQHVIVNIEEKQYEYMARAGMVLEKHLTVYAQTTEIRVVVREPASLGCVTIPAQTFFQGEARPAAPATNAN